MCGSFRELASAGPLGSLHLRPAPQGEVGRFVWDVSALLDTAAAAVTWRVAALPQHWLLASPAAGDALLAPGGPPLAVSLDTIALEPGQLRAPQLLLARCTATEGEEAAAAAEGKRDELLVWQDPPSPPLIVVLPPVAWG